MEQSFGMSFAHVQAHTGDDARAACGDLGAQAYAVGSHVAFADPSPDRALVAHELTHVLQQGAGAAAPAPQAKGDGGTAAHEAQADAIGDAVARGESVASWIGALHFAAPGSVQRKEGADPPLSDKAAEWLRVIELVPGPEPKLYVVARSGEPTFDARMAEVIFDAPRLVSQFQELSQRFGREDLAGKFRDDPPPMHDQVTPAILEEIHGNADNDLRMQGNDMVDTMDGLGVNEVLIQLVETELKRTLAEIELLEGDLKRFHAQRELDAKKAELAAKKEMVKRGIQLITQISKILHNPEDVNAWIELAGMIAELAVDVVAADREDKLELQQHKLDHQQVASFEARLRIHRDRWHELAGALGKLRGVMTSQVDNLRNKQSHAEHAYDNNPKRKGRFKFARLAAHIDADRAYLLRARRFLELLAHARAILPTVLSSRRGGLHADAGEWKWKTHDRSIYTWAGVLADSVGPVRRWMTIAQRDLAQYENARLQADRALAGPHR
jgi:hypothetical protein